MPKSAQQDGSMTSAKVWFGLVTGGGVLGAIGYALFLAQEEVYILGLIIIACLSILAVGFTVLGIMYGLRRYRQMTAIDIGQYGTMIQIGKDMKFVTPYDSRLMISTSKESGPSIESTVVETETVVPTIDDLIDQGMICLGRLVLGFREDGTIREGSWDDLRTFAIAGISASGKSTTLFFIIIQMLLNMAEVYVCDPHATKKRGILEMLQPCWPYMHKASTLAQIKSTVDNFHSELTRRMEGGAYFSPIVLVIDEWTQLATDKQMLAIIIETIELTARAGAGYDAFVVLAGHLWQPSYCGGSKVKDSLHASIVHRISPEQSKHLLSGRFPKLTSTLGVGDCFIFDTQGETEKCHIPNRTVQTALTVARLLQKSGATTITEEATREIASPSTSSTQPLKLDVLVADAKPQLEDAVRAYGDGATSVRALARALQTDRHTAGRLMEELVEKGYNNASENTIVPLGESDDTKA